MRKMMNALRGRETWLGSFCDRREHEERDLWDKGEEERELAGEDARDEAEAQEEETDDSGDEGHGEGDGEGDVNGDGVMCHPSGTADPAGRRSAITLNWAEGEPGERATVK